MSRTIDHLVLATRDLAATADFYRRLGFQVGPRNVHPFGTENHVVQLEDSYLELLGLTAGQRALRAAETAAFSFPRFIENWLDERQGLAMVALAAKDAAADARAFHAARIGDAEPFRFERGGKAADGSDIRLNFALAFARSPLIKAAGFFTCEHGSPQVLRHKGLPQHENSAKRLAGVVMLAENPSAHAEFLGEWLDQRMMLATSMGVEIETGEAGATQKIEVLTAAAARFRLGDAAVGANMASRFIAFRVIVADLDRTRQRLREGGIGFAEREAALVVPPDEAFGATIAFELR